jgi:ABC-2 type transport system ATP-binding protein
MTDAIRAEALSKTYPGEVRAVRDVYLTVRPGEIYAFLGPNGAGKTTTISIFTTLLRPTSGRAEVAGLDVVREPVRIRRRIGLVFQRSTADEALTGRENLEVAAGLYGISPRSARPVIREAIEQIGLDAATADRRVATYSGGMKRRLEIAVGLVHQPEILFLDEPTLGLDPKGRAEFWEYLRATRRQRDLTIFLTTHYLDEADQLSDRVAIIDHGTLLRVDTPTALKDGVGGDRVLVRPARTAPRLERTLAEIPGVASVAPPRPDGTYFVQVARSDSMVPTIVRACDAAGIELATVSTRRPSLDDVYLTITGREYHEDSDPSNGHASATEGIGRPSGGR